LDKKRIFIGNQLADQKEKRKKNGYSNNGWPNPTAMGKKIGNGNYQPHKSINSW
jgi:hypothetical protein